MTFRCYAELNDFLPQSKRQKSFIHPLKTPVTLSEAIESLDIPVSEVDLALVNGQPAPLDQRLFEHDFVSLYPVFESFDISSLKTHHNQPLRDTKFILDAHLGKLSKYLRMLGFDSLYRNDFGDAEIINIAAKEGCIILTRDKALLTSKKVTHGYYVRATEKHAQLIEVVKRFDLFNQFRPFTRCMTCNTELISKNKEEITHLIDEETAENFNAFSFCPKCEKVFWKGSHFQRMESFILDMLWRTD